MHHSSPFRFSASSVFVASALLAWGAVACSATDEGVDFGEGGGGDGVGGGSGGGLLLGGNTGTGGGVSSCTDPGCVGATPQGGCDGALAMDSGDGFDGARALGLCQVASGDSWGVVSARYVRSDGIELTDPALQIGRGILGGFGTLSAREGSQMLVLSSGTARGPNDPGYESVSGKQKDPFTPHGAPPGYPKESPSCPGVITGSPYDSAGLELVIKTPTDAKSFSFNLNFYTYEFPIYICSQFNDFFVALLTPTPTGLTDGNISFDNQGNLISVNAGFLEVCYPQTTPSGKSFACPSGPGELAGTGYDEQPNGSAATGWLETTAPVEAPGTDITLRFAIWDSGDAVLDSTILLDNFQFKAGEGTTGTVPVPK